MFEACVSQTVDLGFISLAESYQKRLKVVITAAQLGAKYKWNSEKKKHASSLVVFSGKTFNRIPPPLRDRQQVGPSSQLVVMTQSNYKLANRALLNKLQSQFTVTEQCSCFVYMHNTKHLYVYDGIKNLM